MYKLGVSVSYSRIIELENLAGSVYDRFQSEGIVCPINLRKGLYTVGALDNIDHNPSSTTAQGSFHGTGISVFQFPTVSNPEQPLAINPEFIGTCSPEDYTTVPAISFQTNTLAVPVAESLANFQGYLNEAQKEESKWIEHGIQLLAKSVIENKDFISWAAFHASLQPISVYSPSLISLLPLFYEKAATLSMVKHGMDIQIKITNHLNPGQIPVMTFDQPLFALAK